jgi:hypothetical protein
MGHFLAVSAFAGRPPDEVARHVVEYASRYGVSCVPTDEQEIDEHHDALVFASARGWTVVLWPAYFNIHDMAACRELSLRMSTLVSTVHVYDDDYWAHLLVRNGEVLDRFASLPGYFAKTPAEKEELRRKWRGDAAAMAQPFGVAADTLRPYLVDLDTRPRPAPARGLKRVLRWAGGTRQVEPEAAPDKAYPDDEFALDNFWVFVDFWRRSGIEYPRDMRKFTAHLRFEAEYQEKLPTGDEEL